MKEGVAIYNQLSRHKAKKTCYVDGFANSVASLIAMAFDASEALKPGHTKIGRVATGDQFVASQEMKDRIIERTGANCTEMEGGAIAQAAYVNGVPFVILRAISDKADHSAEMDYPTFERMAAEHCAAVTEALAKKMAE